MRTGRPLCATYVMKLLCRPLWWRGLFLRPAKGAQFKTWPFDMVSHSRVTAYDVWMLTAYWWNWVTGKSISERLWCCEWLGSDCSLGQNKFPCRVLGNEVWNKFTPEIRVHLCPGVTQKHTVISYWTDMELNCAWSHLLFLRAHSPTKSICSGLHAPEWLQGPLPKTNQKFCQFTKEQNWLSWRSRFLGQSRCAWYRIVPGTRSCGME